MRPSLFALSLLMLPGLLQAAEPQQSLLDIYQLAAERDRKDISPSKKDTPKGTADGTNVQTLQKQLSERDKKIDELSSQLEALKRIDQEMREKVRPIRPPSTVVPPTTPEPSNP